MELSFNSSKRKRGPMSPIADTISIGVSVSKKKNKGINNKKERRLSGDGEDIKSRDITLNINEGKYRSFSEQHRRKKLLRFGSIGTLMDSKFQLVKKFVKQTQMYIQSLYKSYKKRYQLNAKNNDKSDMIYDLYQEYNKGNGNDDEDVLNKEKYKYNTHDMAYQRSSSIDYSLSQSNKAKYYLNKRISSYSNITLDNTNTNTNDNSNYQLSVLSSLNNAYCNQCQRYETSNLQYESNPEEDLILRIKTLIEERLVPFKERESQLQRAIMEKDNEIAQMRQYYEHSTSQIYTIKKEIQCGLNTITNMNQYIQELRNNIRVYCRVKLMDSDTGGTDKKCIYYPEIFEEGLNNDKGLLNTIELKNKDTNASTYYNFDRIIRENMDQVKVFNTLKQSLLLNKILEGESLTSILIGQTNSGKSYTLKGNKVNDVMQPEDNHDILSRNEGIIQRVYSHIIQEAQKQSINIKISIAIAIIHNDTIYELYQNNKGDQYLQSQILSNSHYQLEKWILLSSKEHLNEYLTHADNISLFQKGKESESHIIYQFKIEYSSTNNKKHNDSLITFIKTSGSECLLYPKDNPYYYNTKSIKALGKVLSMLIDKKSNKTQIPYKESKLTLMLRNPIKISFKIVILITISPNESDYDNTNELMKFTLNSMLSY